MRSARALGRHATSIALIALAFGLGVYAYVVDRGSVTDSEKKRRENDVFPAYRRQDVSRVALSPASGPQLVLERELTADGGEAAWRMTSPRHEAADAAAVDRLLGALEYAAVVRKIDAKNGSVFENPRVRGTLGMGRIAYRFALGAPAPSPPGGAYLSVEGQGAYVVARDLVTELTAPADTYRDRTIVPYLSLDLRALEVRGKTSAFAIERMNDKSFRLTATGLRASREGLDAVWGALAATRAESFVADDSLPSGIDSASFVIVMTPKDAGRPAAELALGAACAGHPEQIVAVRKLPLPPFGACVPKAAVEGLDATPASLADRKIISARGDEVVELRIEGQGSDDRKLEIARKGSGWHERSPRDRDLVGDEVDSANALVNAVARAAGDHPRRRNEKETLQAKAKLTIQKVDDGGEEVVLVGSLVPGGGAAVQRLEDDALLDVGFEVLRRLSPSEISLRGKSLFTPPLDSSAMVRLETHCDGVDQALIREDRGWSMQSPAGQVPDNAGAIELVDALGRAKVDAWVADQDDGTLGLSNRGGCFIELGTRGDAGARNVRLIFGAVGEGGVYARVDGETGVFVLPKAMRALASRWLIDRSGLQIALSDMETVEISGRGHRHAYERKGDQIVSADGGGGETAEKVLDALATLRADAVLHPGPPRGDEGFLAPSLDVLVKRGRDAGGKTFHLVIGRSTIRLGERQEDVRVEGIDATFAVSHDRLAALFDAL